MHKASPISFVLTSEATATFSASQPPAIPADVAGSEAIVLALELVVRELGPRAATFFGVGDSGEARSCFVHGPDLSAAGFRQVSLRGVDPLVLEELAASPRPVVTLTPDPHPGIGATNDVWLLIRDDERLIAGITLWRELHSPAWTGRQLRLLAALQPLIEMAYLSALRDASSVDAVLPAVLTPRQREVARMLATGATNAEVARALSISADTAKSHTRAVLAKMAVASRRELVMRLTRRRAGSVRSDADETAEQLLSLVLEWAVKRIGAVVGGCALFSARLDPVAQFWMTARVGARHLDRALVRRLHGQLSPPAGLSEIVRAAVADHPRSGVLQLDLTGADPEDPLGGVVARLGLSTPLLTVLRLQGRIRGLIWLSADARAGLDPRESVQVLRGLHPLLELAYAARLALVQAPISNLADLADRGLTARELAVARRALRGQSNAEIAAGLGISQSTVKHHMGRILAKCGVRSRTQLIALVGNA